MNTDVNSSRATFLAHMETLTEPEVGADESKEVDPEDLASELLAIHNMIETGTLRDKIKTGKYKVNSLTNELNNHIQLRNDQSKNPYDFIRILCMVLKYTVTPSVDEDDGKLMIIRSVAPIESPTFIQISQKRQKQLKQEPFSIITHQTEEGEKNNLYYGFYCCGDQWYRYNSVDGTSLEIGDYDELMTYQKGWIDRRGVMFLYAMDS